MIIPSAGDDELNVSKICRYYFKNYTLFAPQSKKEVIEYSLETNLLFTPRFFQIVEAIALLFVPHTYDLPHTDTLLKMG